MELIGVVVVPGIIEGAIRSPQADMMSGRGRVLRHTQQSIKYCKLGERAVYVTLARAAFWVECVVFGTIESVGVPLFQGGSRA